MIPDLLAHTATLRWQDSPDQALFLAESLLPLATKVAQVLPSLDPDQEVVAVWHSPGYPFTYLEPRTASDWQYTAAQASKAQKLAQALSDVLETQDPVVAWQANPHLHDPYAIRIASGTASPVIKQAQTSVEPLIELLASTGLVEAETGMFKNASMGPGYSPMLRGLGEMAGYLPDGPYSWKMPGVPRHLQGMLGGGILGGAMGYGAGWLGSQVLPDSWNKRKLRRNGMLAGMAMGVAPGALAMGAEAGTRPGLAGEIFDSPRPDAWAHAMKTSKSRPDLSSFDKLCKQTGNKAPYGYCPQCGGRGINRERCKDGNDQCEHGCTYPSSQHLKQSRARMIREANEAVHVELPSQLKRAISQTGVDEFKTQLPAVDANHFANIIWGDPRVAGSMSLPERAAASGLVSVAARNRAQMTGDDSGLVYPTDIARVALGMGSGYLSGAIVGKALGELVGLPMQTQERLKNVGLWAGVVKGVLPLIFGR